MAPKPHPRTEVTQSGFSPGRTPVGAPSPATPPPRAQNPFATRHGAVAVLDREPALLPDAAIVGFTVQATDGDMGTVHAVISGAEGGSIVVDTGPWVFGKKVVLPAVDIERVDFSEERVWIGRSRDEVKNAPEFEALRNADT